MRKIAKVLLERKAVTLNVIEPYTYVSGIRSPIYCDNRVLIFYPQERMLIVQAFSRILDKMDAEVIAGTATSGIPWAAWVASQMEKPMVYIRKKGKGYGADKLVEGGSIEGRKVAVIEDLVSTGGSSANAVQTCIDAGAEIAGMVAIFTYGFEKAKERFRSLCRTEFLTNFSTLVDVAAENEYIDPDKLLLVREWNKDPQGWGPKHGFPPGEKKN